MEARGIKGLGLDMIGASSNVARVCHGKASFVAVCTIQHDINRSFSLRI